MTELDPEPWATIGEQVNTQAIPFSRVVARFPTWDVDRLFFPRLGYEQSEGAYPSFLESEGMSVSAINRTTE